MFNISIRTRTGYLTRIIESKSVSSASLAAVALEYTNKATALDRACTGNTHYVVVKLEE